MIVTSNSGPLFIEAENSMGFHAPEEAARILAESIDFARKGQATLAGLTIQVPSPAPASPAPQQASGAPPRVETRG